MISRSTRSRWRSPATGRASCCRRRGRWTISTPAGCASCIDAASATIRRGCCGWSATRRGSGSPSIRARTRWSATRCRSRALRTVTAPRVGAELRLLAAEPDPVAALAALAPFGLDAAIELGFGLDGREPAASALALLDGGGDAGALALAVASRGIDQAGRAEFFGRLGFDAARRDLIAEIARTGPVLAPRLRRARAASSIAAAVGRAPVEAVALAGALGAADNARRWIEQLRFVTLSIGGADLIAAGVPGGPAIGAGLRAALSAKLDGRVGDRDEELAVALRAARARTDRADG